MDVAIFTALPLLPGVVVGLLVAISIIYWKNVWAWATGPIRRARRRRRAAK